MAKDVDFEINENLVKENVYSNEIARNKGK